MHSIKIKNWIYQYYKLVTTVAIISFILGFKSYLEKIGTLFIFPVLYSVFIPVALYYFIKVKKPGSWWFMFIYVTLPDITRILSGFPKLDAFPIITHMASLAIGVVTLWYVKEDFFEKTNR